MAMRHTFMDRDGVEWTVSWKSTMLTAKAVGGDAIREKAGLEFLCNALIFRVPTPYWVDPRAVPPSRLQAMVDGALSR